MSDTFIDQYEREIYGQIFIRRAGRWAAEQDLDDDERAIVRVAIAWVEEANAPIIVLVAERNAGTIENRAAAVGKQPTVSQARGLVVSLDGKLQELVGRSHVIDRQAFRFPTAVKSTTRRVSGLATTIFAGVKLCAHYADKHPELAAYHDELAAAAQGLSSNLDHAADTSRELGALTPELQLACKAWDQAYGAAKSLLRGLLAMRGELGLLRYFFHDLAVPANTRLSADPGDGPAAT